MQGAQTVGEVARVEADAQRFADELHRQVFVGLAAVVAAGRRQVQRAISAELHPYLLSASGSHQGDPLDRLGEIPHAKGGHRGVLHRQQLPILGKVGVEQAMGAAPIPAVQTQQLLAAQLIAAAEGEVNICAGRQRLRGLGKGLGRHDHRGLDITSDRGPREFAHRQPKTVGGYQHHLVARDLNAYTTQHGEHVVEAGRDGDLADGLGEQLRRHHTGLRRSSRKIGVGLHGHHRKREPRTATNQLKPSTVAGQLNRQGRKQPRDL